MQGRTAQCARTGKTRRVARKAYLENQNADVGVLAALRCDMLHQQRVASQSHEKMVKLKQIEAALLDRAAKIVKKRLLSQ